MPHIVAPRSAKQAFVSAFGAVPPLLAADAARRGANAPRGERAGWFLMAAVHALPGAYFADGFLRPRARTSPNLVGLHVATAVGLALGLRFAARHPAAWGSPPRRPSAGSPTPAGTPGSARALGGAGDRGDAPA